MLLGSRHVVVERMRARRAGLKARVQSAFDHLDGLLASRRESSGASVTEADVVAHLRRERSELYQRVLAADRHVSHLAAVEQDLIRLRGELQALTASLRGS